MKTAKALGLAICSALVLTAMVGASAASAQQFRAEEYPATATGQTSTFKFTTWEKGPTWTCTSATGNGTIAAASTTLSLTPTFSVCQWAGFSGVTTKMNSCKLVFNNSGEPLINTGTMNISCSTEGDQIEVTAGGLCTLKIPAQSARGPVEYSDAAGLQGYQRKINVTPNATGFKYSVAGVFCPGKVGSFEDGVMSGNWLVKGKNEQHEVGVYLGNEQSANLPMFVAESYPETVNASLVEASSSFAFPNVTGAEGFSCSTLNGNGLIDGIPDGQLTLALRAWSGCGAPVSIKRNGCSFTLAGPIGGSGSLALECPAGKEVVVSAPLSCVVSIPPQGGLSTVKYTETGSGSARVVTAEAEIKTLKFTAASKCWKPGTFSNGELTFDWLVKGAEFLGYEQKTEEGVQYFEYLGGAQRGIWIE